MKIPFMRLDRQFAERKKEYLRAVEDVFTHGNVLQGPEVSELEEKLALMFRMKNAVAVSSGTDALVLAMKALKMKPGVRVAVTALSFVASASAIVRAGGVPVFVDIEPDYYCAREDVLLDLIRKGKVDGIIAVHLYGQMMELKDLYNEAQKRGIFIIEDAAQTLGSTRNGMPPGGYSDATCVSFDPTKVIGAHGSGGAVLSNDPKIAEQIRLLRYHGHAGKRIYSEIGFNSQLPTVQAALLLEKLNHEEEWRKRREEIAERYTSSIDPLAGIAGPKVRSGNTHNYHKYVTYINDKRDDLNKYLNEKGIGTSIHYSLPLHKQPCFIGRHESVGDMTTVEKTVDCVLSLPIYPELTDEEVDYVCKTIQSYFDQ